MTAKSKTTTNRVVPIKSAKPVVKRATNAVKALKQAKKGKK